MKKFMKAIAFATVMCMLLSTVAFAADLTIADAKVTVTVNAGAEAANEQIAFVVSTATTVAGIGSGNIKDVQQVALDANGSRTIELGTGDATEATVYYGYKGVTEAQSLTAAAVVQPNDKVVITGVDILTDDEITNHDFVTEGATLPETETDKAGAIIATVDVQKEEGKTIAGMFWSIRYGTNDVAYVEADDALFSLLEGPIEIGLAFSNGNNSEGDAAITEVEVTGLHAIVILRDAENNENIIYSDATDFDSNNRN